MDSPVSRAEVLDAANQEVAIEARGPDVLNIEGNLPEPRDSDAIMPDWIELIVEAANLGMMSSGAAPPGSSRATLAGRIFDPATVRMQWTVTLEQIDPGVCLVMLNVLRARRLDDMSIRTVTASPGVRRLDERSLTYPAPCRDAPFEISREAPLRTTRGRMIQIEFANSPSVEEQSVVAGAFDVWGQLLILGGYAAPERDPGLAHTLPDVPYWLDEVTFVQPFAESFESDEACFNAITGWAARIHRQGTAVRSIAIE